MKLLPNGLCSVVEEEIVEGMEEEAEEEHADGGEEEEPEYDDTSGLRRKTQN
jgi:hypothetical protein